MVTRVLYPSLYFSNYVTKGVLHPLYTGYSNLNYDFNLPGSG